MFETKNNKTMLSDTSYSIGKKLVQVYIPAVSSLYFGLSSIWGLPATEQVVGTFAVVATFLGVCLGLSSRQYDASEAAYDGEMISETDDSGKTTLRLVLNDEADVLAEKDTISFKVVRE